VRDFESRIARLEQQIVTAQPCTCEEPRNKGRCVFAAAAWTQDRVEAALASVEFHCPRHGKRPPASILRIDNPDDLAA